MRLSEVAEIIDARLDGDPAAEVRGLARIEDAAEGELTFLAHPKYQRFLSTTHAAAVLVPADPKVAPERDPSGPAFLYVTDPYIAFLHLAGLFYPAAPPPAPGIHPSAVISPSAVLGRRCSIGAHVVIGDDCRIGDRVIVSHGSVIDNAVVVGDDSHIMENVVVKFSTRIGKRVSIYPGCVIAGDGFGFTPKSDGTYEKIPQRGIVVIGDDVEIGSNCAIDRAMIGETRVGDGVKLDNLIQVGHNVVIGDHTVIVAQTGIAGSTRLGKHCMVGGQVGIVGHIRIADNVSIGAQSGVSRSLDQPGQTYSSSPVKEHRRALRIEGALRQLPEMLTDLRALRDEVERLRGTRVDPPPTSGPTTSVEEEAS